MNINDYYKKNKLPIQKINLFGVRNESGQKEDLINDQLGFFTEQEFFLCDGTTDPGVYWVISKERNPAGTFHLIEGYHDKIWTFGKHKGYDALVNDYKKCKPTKGWRDANFNFMRDDADKIVCDYFGVNFHRMNENVIVKLIGKYSAGCQVIQDIKNFNYIYDACKKSGETVFNYMLFKKGEVEI